MWFKCILRGNIENCFICSLRPLLYGGFTITFAGKVECPHSSMKKRASISSNTLSVSLAIVCVIIMMTDLIMNLTNSNLFKEFSEEKASFYDILLPNYINTLNYSTALIVYNKRYLKFTNGLIMLIDRRSFFGIHTIINKKYAILLQIWSLTWVIAILLISLLFSVTLVMGHSFNLATILRFLSVFVNNMNALNFGVYLLTTPFIYRLLFTVCLNKISSTLKEKQLCGRSNTLVRISLCKRLQFLQQFYLLVCFNYKNHVVAFGNALFFSGQFVFSVFSVIQSCLSTATALAIKNVDTNWMMIMGRFYHVFLVVSTMIVFTEITWNRNLNEDTLSFLYKYPISKLSSMEADQVEMLITTLTIRKPDIRGADLFSVGIELFVPISGVVVTYILVALQFHASFMSYTNEL